MFNFDCSNCETRCDGKSKGVYIFKNDVDYAEEIEKEVASIISEKFHLFVKKTDKDGYPDLEVYEYENGPLKYYVEVKAQRRTFMSVERILPHGNLIPSETMALNQSDLVRYFDIYKKESVPIFLMWVLSHRPCITSDEEHRYFYERVDKLEKIFKKYGKARTFRRGSGKGDVVNGEHKGVVVNYHFSLNELTEAKKFNEE